MPYGITPPPQRGRLLTFSLFGGAGGGVELPLMVRPESISRVEPSRIAVQQTLAGAWADAFDRGVATIRIAGHCGWRGSAFESGEQAFMRLRQGVFQGWHDARAAVIAGGGDPNEAVQLYMVDALDNFMVLAAPKSFSLERSKTSPLLMRYRIELLQLNDASTPGVPGNATQAALGALANPLSFLGAASALQSAAANILGSLGAFA